MKENDIFYIEEYSKAFDFVKANNYDYYIEEIAPDEKGRRFTILRSPDKSKEAQIGDLKLKLYDTDYVASKIADAYAKYQITGDDHALDEMIAKYEPILQQREQWREQIRELEKQINE